VVSRSLSKFSEKISILFLFHFGIHRNIEEIKIFAFSMASTPVVTVRGG
jgi:hypothetical protein